MAEPGRVGGEVVAVGDASPVVIESKLAHGLFDGDRIRITSLGAADRPLLAYVKSTGYGANTFAVFSDSALKQPAQLNGSVAPDATIDCLAQTDRAIVVGINVYPTFTSLKGPTKDASEFAAWVKSGIGGCVPDDHVKLIQSPPYETSPTIEDVEPTLLKVAKAFQDLANMANRADDHYLGRRLYIFMSGHGILPTRSAIPNFDETALLMANSPNGNYTMHIGGQSHAEYFRAAGVFDEVVLFMDCCRDFMDDVAPLQPLLPFIQPMRPSARRFYGAATQLGSKSWEKPFDDDDDTRGIFSYVLLNALRNEALCDPKGRLTGKLLASDLHANVPKLMNNQAPDIFYKESEDLVFAKRLTPKKPNVNITFDAAFYSKTAKLWGNDQNNPIAEHLVDAKPWNITLDLDRYIISIEDEDVKGFRITSSEETWNAHVR